jgi:hypothetical protein
MQLTDYKTLTPEQKILVNAIRVPGSEEIPETDFSTVKIDWVAVQLLAVHHRVVPLLYDYLKNQKLTNFPSEEKVRLRMLYLANMAQNLRLTQRLFELVGFLGEKGIEILSYKGPVLAQRAYGNLSRRFFVDLDVFVCSRDFPRLYWEMTRAGYRPMSALSKKQGEIWSRFGREFVFSRDKLMIDIHMRLTEGPGFLAVEKTLWPDRTIVQLESKSIPALSLENSLLALCIHGTKHGWQSLGLVADIAHLVSSNPGLNWEKIYLLAKKVGCMSMVGVGLRLSQVICGLQLDGVLPDRFIRSSRVKRHATEFFEQIFSDNPTPGKFRQRFIQLTAFDSIAKNVQNLGYYLFTPKFKDLKTFSLHPGLVFLYYVLRPIRLFIDMWTIGIKKLLKND